MTVIPVGEVKSSELRRWKIGDVTVTKFVEMEELNDLNHVFPKATVEALLAIPWLQPNFLTPEGRAIFSFHALVVDTPTKRIIVDTCHGNDKDRRPWDRVNNLQTSFLRNLEGAGYARDSFDVVLCTHLHVDHVGWNTMWVGGKWVPTFPKARYILNKTEYEYWKAPEGVPTINEWDKIQSRTFDDSVKPIVDAGLVDLVEGTHRVCDEVTLVPTLGHSPGHVSVRIRSRGEEAFITGDMCHHPSQLVHPDWGLEIEHDVVQSAKTRKQVFTDVADKPILVIGTHWSGVTAGKVIRDGQAFRLVF